MDNYRILNLLWTVVDDFDVSQCRWT